MAKQDWTILNQLGDVILQNVAGDLVEIGLGRSTQIFVKLASNFCRRLYCFDISERKCKWAEEHGATAFLGPSVHMLRFISSKQLALILIDGDHRYETVKQEVDFLLPKLSLGGIMFLHDTAPPLRWARENGRNCGVVYKNRLELETKTDLQVFTWPYTAADCGLTMVMRKDPNRPYWKE